MPLDDTEYRIRPHLSKMDGVIGMLDHESKWCKDVSISDTGQRCIFGAMMNADGVHELYTPILLAIEQVTGKNFEYIEHFNDAPETTYLNVITVLEQARINVMAGICDLSYGERDLAKARERYKAWINRPKLSLVQRFWQRVFH